MEVKIAELDQLKNLVYVSVISADNDEFDLTEDDKQEIIRRKDLSNDDWEWIFEPVKDENKRGMLIELFKKDE